MIAEVIDGDEPGARRGVPRGARDRGLPRAVPGEAGARHGGDRGALAARQHHAHLGDGRRGRVRVGHVLERLVLGRGGARHRHAPEQHAGRAGPEPARLPPPRAGRAGAEHDGADRGAVGRRARDRDRQRRLEPDPLGDPPDGPARDRRGDAPRRRRSRRRGCTWRTGQVDAEPGVDPAALDRLEQARLDRPPLERAEPVLRRRAGGRAKPRHGPPHRWRRPAPGWCRDVVVD